MLKFTKGQKAVLLTCNIYYIVLSRLRNIVILNLTFFINYFIKMLVLNYFF